MAGRWWQAGVLLTAAALSGCGGAATPAEGNKDEKEEAQVAVQVVPARLGTERATVEGLGRCEALPDHLATLTPALEGHVHDLLVKEGEPVKKSQPIVMLDPTVAQADLAEKTATRDGLKASLALLQSLPRAEERRPDELAVEHAKVAADLAQAALTRLQPLRDRHEVSEQQYHDAEVALEQARILQQTAEATLRTKLIGPRPEAVAEAQGKIKTADAAVAFSQAHLEYHTIRAPIDGLLESLTCHPGQTIAVGTAIGEIVDSRQVFASLWLAPRSALAVRIGQLARLTPQDIVGASEEKKPAVAAADDPPDDLAGKVAFVGRVADPQTGNLPIHVLVDNPNGKLTIGESVRVAIILSERRVSCRCPPGRCSTWVKGPCSTWCATARRSCSIRPTSAARKRAG